ncbi:hypothetical protein GF412_04670 [Candidatus Micrarchaeota archaeon]|nr:hypothetical protein [Candidatus Micrarchaeota archaeon]MBD3418246.1 hypothetical protein [Candidatus Micrarchaeota archaeon]
MGGTANSLPPEVCIQKSPAELSALVEKHAHAVSNGIDYKVREYALFDLMDVLISNPSHISPKAVKAVASALSDKDEHVSVTADLALTVLVKDHAEKVFPLLAKEEADAKPKHAKKIAKAIRSIYALCSFRERVKLRDLSARFRKQPIRPEKPKQGNPRETQKLQRVA